MHSRMFQLIITKPCENKEIDDSLIDSFVREVADYVYQSKSRNQDIDWILSYLGGIEECNELFVYDDKEQSIIFKEGFKLGFFERKHQYLKEYVQELSLEGFSGEQYDDGAIYKLQQCISEEYEFYIVDEEWWYPLDQFVRGLSYNTKYYFGEVLDYHF